MGNKTQKMKHMLQKRNDLEIVEILRREKSHIRKISKKLNQIPSTTQRILKKLEKEKVVDFELQGKNKIYFLKPTIEARVYLKMSEEYKLLKLIQNPFMKSIVKEIISIINCEMILIFGSYAKNLEKNSSDIDIYIETKNKKLKENISKINSKMNVKIGELKKRMDALEAFCIK